MFKLTSLLLMSFWILMAPSSATAFWINVHEEIADRTIEKNKDAINLAIKSQTGLDNALNFVTQIAMQNKNLKKWTIFGSSKEDDSPRYLNHFYNPITGSGLNDLFSGKPSIEWADYAGNEWSWRSGRNNFHLGLTAATDAERRAALADSFRALGQVMHLLQDSAVPAHVRNDAHPLGDGFESYTSKNVDTLNYTPIPFAGPKHSLRPYAPRQLWDSDQYDGINPSTSAAIGLAEYTNANFASEDTIFTENNLNDRNPLNDNHYFPFPRREDTLVFAESQNTTWNGFEVYRKYFEKVGGGQPIKHFATASRLYAYLLDDPDPSLQGLDDRCHKDYADLLIPRAVGYSAALIDYFFRGKIDMETDPESSGKYIIKNESDEDMSGTFSLYYDDTDGERKKITEWRLEVESGGESEPVSFTEPDDAEEAGKYILVFCGSMGAEKGAMAGKVVEIVVEPPPYLFISTRGNQIDFGVVWHIKEDREVPVHDDTGEIISPPYQIRQAEISLGVRFISPFIHNYEVLPGGNYRYDWMTDTFSNDCGWERTYSVWERAYQESKYSVECVNENGYVSGTEHFKSQRQSNGEYFGTVHIEYEINNDSAKYVSYLNNSGILGPVPYGQETHRSYFYNERGSEAINQHSWQCSAGTLHTSANVNGGISSNESDYRWPFFEVTSSRCDSSLFVYSHAGRAILREESHADLEVRERGNWEDPPLVAEREYDKFYAVQYDRPFLGGDFNDESNYDYKWTEFRPLNLSEIKLAMGYYGGANLRLRILIASN